MGDIIQFFRFHCKSFPFVRTGEPVFCRNHFKVRCHRYRVHAGVSPPVVCRVGLRTCAAFLFFPDRTPGEGFGTPPAYGGKQKEEIAYEWKQHSRSGGGGGMMDGGQQHQTRNYIGIAGCLIALLGMALPYVDAWIVRASLFSLLADFAAFAIPLVLLALVCAVILCVQGNHQVRWIGIVLLLLLLAITFLDDENIVEDVSDLLGSGFWVMVIGLVIIILSPSFSLGNILSNTSPHQPSL